MFLALLMVLGLQSAHATTLTEDMATIRIDFYNLISKGLVENRNLVRALREVDQNLGPYVNQYVGMTPDWSRPLWQMHGDYTRVFSAENQNVNYALDKLELTAQNLMALKYYNCSYVDAQFARVRGKMREVWEDRKQDSQGLLDKITAVAYDVDHVPGGRFYVQPSWLYSITETADYSETWQRQMTSDLEAVNYDLNAVIDNIRQCYHLD